MAKFYMLIGLPACGKTGLSEEFTKKLNNCEVFSSDCIGKELYGDENIQDNPGKVFEIMQQRTILALKNGHDVIYDATNIRRKNRRHLLQSLPSCHKCAVIVWSKPETCVERDKERTRNVGKQVIYRMLRNFQPPYYDEGWDDIQVVHNDSLYNVMDYCKWVDCEHDNPHHNNTVAEHIHKVCELAVSAELPKHLEPYGSVMFISAFLHDIGKKHTKSFINAKGEKTEIAHYYDHQNVGSYLALGYEDIKSIKNSTKFLIVWLINNHMEPFFNSKYYKGLKGIEKDLLDFLHHCDKAGA